MLDSSQRADVASSLATSSLVRYPALHYILLSSAACKPRNDPLPQYVATVITKTPQFRSTFFSLLIEAVATMISTDEYQYRLGSYHHKVTTDSPKAQVWFDRGLIWCYAFHHEESARCFERAINEDPKCAMAYWGVGRSSNLYVKAGIRADTSSSLSLSDQITTSRGISSMKMS
jgi:hypothetical protein